MIKIIEHRNEWESWLLKMDHFDFYHTYDYHHLLSKPTENVILIAYEQQDIMIGLPFIKRDLGNGYHDLTSIHGYLGPISKNVDGSFENSDFKIALQDLLQRENIVAVFSKLNPFIPSQCNILKDIGAIEHVGELVYFDQTEKEEIQRSAYNRNTRQVLKKLRRECIVKIGDFHADLHSFIFYYHKSLDKLKAKPIFYFNEDYFDALAQSSLFESEILFTMDKQTHEIMAGVLLIKTNQIAHIELAFTVEKFLKSSPLRLLFDECRKRYRRDNIKILNLGGGRGGKQGSLMRFKSSFSKNYANYNVWKYVVIPEVYEYLLTPEQKGIDSDFFPKYRLITA